MLDRKHDALSNDCPRVAHVESDQIKHETALFDISEYKGKDYHGEETAHETTL